ncbi:hypothetical protein RKD37_001293 [Streptomyces ambofaciens]
MNVMHERAVPTTPRCSVVPAVLTVRSAFSVTTLLGTGIQRNLPFLAGGALIRASAAYEAFKGSIGNQVTTRGGRQ